MGGEELKWRQLKTITKLAHKDIIYDRFSILQENPYEEVDDDENDIYYY